MTGYFVEYMDDETNKLVTLAARDKANAYAAARRVSKKTKSMVYVLDDNREGHAAFTSGYLDHKEGNA